MPKDDGKFFRAYARLLLLAGVTNKGDKETGERGEKKTGKIEKRDEGGKKRYSRGRASRETAEWGGMGKREARVHLIYTQKCPCDIAAIAATIILRSACIHSVARVGACE